MVNPPRIAKVVKRESLKSNKIGGVEYLPEALFTTTHCTAFNADSIRFD